ncbi:unnamed protein product [Closterium sp. NIES-64]|nr:unnamed protein product [Closterium sp. NIES-64]
MVRLTADLILESPQYFNAVREREIDLRGNKIAVIENLGATEDLVDSIDLSDNEIVKLEGFPLLRRLSTLLLCNNRITRISPQLAHLSKLQTLVLANNPHPPKLQTLVLANNPQLPKLQTLVLANNRLTNLADLDPLASLAHSLTSLSLLDNTKPKYRLYEIHLLPKLRLLDFQKVKLKKPKYRLYAIHLLPKLRLLDFREVKLKEWQGVSVTFGKDRAAAVAVMPELEGREQQQLVVLVVMVGRREGRGAAATAVAAKGPTPEQITAIKVKVPPMCEGEGPFHV